MMEGKWDNIEEERKERRKAGKGEKRRGEK